MPRGPDRSLQRRSRGQGAPGDVVDNLGHHVTVGTEDGEPGTCRRAADLFPDPVMVPALPSDLAVLALLNLTSLRRFAGLTLYDFA